ncbi:GYD domain-containing protein [Candidatus Woesearchaeota archaeon]|nr:GYD domain-containing protein [Candidatus Woesearchaeota archaeon]
MAYFIRLVRFTAEGLRELKQFKVKRAEFLEHCKSLGISLVAEYVTSGRYDLVTILEAPNLDTLLRLNALTGSKGRTIGETLSAIPAKDFEWVAESF